MLFSNIQKVLIGLVWKLIPKYTFKELNDVSFVRNILELGVRINYLTIIESKYLKVFHIEGFLN